MLADALHLQGVHPNELPDPRTTHMSSAACERSSRRRRGKEGAYGTSAKAKPRQRTPPRRPASADTQMIAAPTPPRPAALWEPRAPHILTRLTPQPAALHLTPRGD